MLTLAAWVHDLDPFAIWPIRWYGLSYVFGFMLAFFLVRRITKVGISTLKPVHVSDYVVTVAIAILIGGRLGYVLFYKPDYLWTFTSSPPWWETLAMNRGGMSSHGGILGFIFGSIFYAKRHGHRMAHILDLGAYAAPIGLCFGRLANFVNGELYGRACDPDMPFAVKFPQETVEWVVEGKTEKLEQLLPILDPPPTATVSNLDWNQAIQYLLNEIQSGNTALKQAVEPILTPRHPSQIYQALLEGLLLFLILAAIWVKPRKPLVIGWSFCICYGILRIIGEFFRLPDAHIANEEFARFGITRGQWLSALFVVAGIIGLIIVSRKDWPKMGSWRPQPEADRLNVEPVVADEPKPSDKPA